MSFPWLQTAPPRSDGVDRRVRFAVDELTSRAGLLFRLGYSEAAATRRLRDGVAWEFEAPAHAHGAHRRPDALSDQAIAKIVTATYARRPG
jgi:hypothetical protein